MTSGSAGGADTLSLLAVAANRTKEIMLGTAITQTFSRQPVAVAQQVLVLAQLAPEYLRRNNGRCCNRYLNPIAFRLSHDPTVFLAVFTSGCRHFSPPEDRTTDICLVLEHPSDRQRVPITPAERWYAFTVECARNLATAVAIVKFLEYSLNDTGLVIVYFSLA